jgi:hypothetical protein
MERRERAGGGGGGDREFRCIISKGGDPL